MLAQAGGPSHAQAPSAEAFEAAVQQARPLARSLGLSLHADALWLAALRARAPMLALRVGSACHLAYAAYTPGQDHGWLFPVLPAAQRQAWLQGFVQHELAHCALQSVPAGPHAAALSGASADAADALAGVRHAERLADLAFARHLDTALPIEQADALIDRLAGLRAGRRALDPGHDTAAALDCHRRHPLRWRHDLPWRVHLQVLGEACAGSAMSP